MQLIQDRSLYYSYKEAAEKLGISYPHLIRIIQLKAFHPVRPFKGNKKYLLRIDVDSRVGRKLYLFKKKNVTEEQAAPALDPGNINDIPASEALEIIGKFALVHKQELEQFEAQVLSRIDSGEKVTWAEVDAVLNKIKWQAYHDSYGLLPLLNEHKVTTGEYVELTQEEEEEVNQSGDKRFISTDEMTFLEYKESIRKFGLQADEEIDNT